MTNSEKYKIANDKLNTKFDRITILVEKGKKAYYKKEAAKRNMNTTHFFILCASEYLKKEN